MPRRVIVNAMIQPYDGPIGPNDEVWAVNGAFRHSKRGVTRVYAMDDLQYLPRGWADEVNLMPPSIRYIAPRHFDEIPRSEAFPIVDIIRYFNGARFFTSTFAYIMAAAIYEGVTHMVLSGAHWPHDSEEYMSHLPSINFWAGMAMGKGMRVEVHGPCCIARPYAWESGLYGYETNANREVVHVALAAAYKFAATFPYESVVHVDVDQLIKDQDKTLQLTA